MAETISIASRMEKLARLKRMKMGLSGDSEPKAADPAPASIAAAVSEPEIDSPTEAYAPSVADHGTESGYAPEPEAPVETDFAAPDLTTEIEAETAGAFDAVEDTDAAAAYWSNEADETAATASDNADVAFDEAVKESEAAFDFADQDPAEQPTLETSEDTALEAMSEGFAADEDDVDTAIPADLMDAETDLVEAETQSDPVTVESQADLDKSLENIASDEATSPAMTAADLGIEDDGAAGLDEMAAIAEIENAVEASGPAIVPDFAAKEIDPELLEREFEHETAGAMDIPVASQIEDGRVSLTFDDSRSTLLNHVSRQMNCSIEDVVVTALDWYLDALFGEDGEAKSA